MPTGATVVISVVISVAKRRGAVLTEQTAAVAAVAAAVAVVVVVVVVMVEAVWCVVT